MHYSDFTTGKENRCQWFSKLISGKIKAGIKSKVCSNVFQFSISINAFYNDADFTNDWTFDEVKLISSDCDYMNWCRSRLIFDSRCITYRNRINYLWLKFVKIKSLQIPLGKWLTAETINQSMTQMKLGCIRQREEC